VLFCIAQQLNTLPEFSCQTPQVTEKICNGMVSFLYRSYELVVLAICVQKANNSYYWQYPNSVGLLQNCPFEYFPWTTCYGCPVEPPTPANPVPAQASISGQALRFRIPSNCSTPFWDPIGGKCLCSDRQCQFSDETKSIGPNGQNVSSLHFIPSCLY